MSTQVIFKFDKEDDLKNIWDTCNDNENVYGINFKDYVPKNILKICEGKKYGKCKKELEKALNYIYKSKVIEVIVESFNKGWKKIEKEYFERLEKIMKCSFKSKKVVAYLTNSPRCPYYPDTKPPIFHTFFSGNVLTTIQVAGHELMHIQFHNSKYWKICEKELGNKKTYDLKEALTILLNLEFQDLLVLEDEGYLNHAELRKYITKEWKKEKNLDKLISNSIKWIKKNGVK